MDKVYCVIYFPGVNRAIALNRDYRVLSEDREVWGKVQMKDIVETSEVFLPPHIPEWALEADSTGLRHIALWTNYYEVI